jgi:uncharacterized protein
MSRTAIAVVADTHLPRFGRALPAALVRGIRDANPALILHAGDWTDELALRLLEELAPVEGVAGNNDGPALHARFGTRRVLDVDGARIGITHGHLGRGATTLDRARDTFADQPRSAPAAPADEPRNAPAAPAHEPRNAPAAPAHEPRNAPAARPGQQRRTLDAIVFGHSHTPHIHRDPAGGPWLVNPGSPTDRRREPAFSWALLVVDGGRVVDVELVRYADRAPD